MPIPILSNKSKFDPAQLVKQIVETMAPEVEDLQARVDDLEMRLAAVEMQQIHFDSRLLVAETPPKE